MSHLFSRLWAIIAAHLAAEPVDPIDRYLSEATDVMDCQHRLRMVQAFDPRYAAQFIVYQPPRAG